MLSAICMIGCTPAFAPGSPEAVVSSVYAPFARSGGPSKTALNDLPLTENLRWAVWGAGFISDVEFCSWKCHGDLRCVSRARCVSNAKPAALENDVIGFCTDCSGFSGLKISRTADYALNLPTKVISATFQLSSGRTRSVYFHMVNGKQGWQIDNIVGSDRFNLRQVALDTRRRADESLGIATHSK